MDLDLVLAPGLGRGWAWDSVLVDKLESLLSSFGTGEIVSAALRKITQNDPRFYNIIRENSYSNEEEGMESRTENICCV